MKKLAVAVMVSGMLASGVFAQSNEVSSVNVVGFQNVTVASNGYTMVALPFYALDGTNTLDAVLEGQLTQGNTSADADNVIFFDAASQSYVRNWKSPIGWLTGGSPSTQEFWTARGFWVKTAQLTNQSLRLKGDVPLSNSTTQTVYEGYNLIAYPYPADVVVTNTDLHANATQGNTSAEADNLIKWDANGSVYVRYWLSPIGWLQGGTPAPDLKLNQGEAFWFLRRSGNGSFLWVEDKPYSL